jgi:hypothetical protein
MREFLALLFSIASGLTVSGIVANLYWLAVKPSVRTEQGIAHSLVMAIAGPTVWIDRVTRSFRAQKSSGAVCFLTISACLYWAFVIGVFILSIAFVI